MVATRMISRRDLVQGLVSLATTLAVMGAAPGGENLRINAPEPCNAGQHQEEKRGQERKTLRAIEACPRTGTAADDRRRHQSWDKVLVPILLAGFLAILIVAGLDGSRFHWVPPPAWAVFVGYGLMVLGWLGSG